MSDNMSATDQVVAELAKVATLTPEALRVIYAFVYANSANVSRLESRVEDLEEEMREVLPLVRDPHGNSFVYQVRQLRNEMDAILRFRESVEAKERVSIETERKQNADDARARWASTLTAILAAISIVLTLINLVRK